jgi:hypothetical protein
MFVVAVAQVRIAGLLRGFDLSRQGRGPFRPGEVAGPMQADGKGEGLGLPGRGEDRGVAVARQAAEK